MKTWKQGLAVSLLALSACGSISDGQTGQGFRGGALSVSFEGVVHEDLTPEARADLEFLREEEKLARDVYLHLYDLWQLRPHRNIADSEQRHMDAVGVAVEAYGIADPAVENEFGTFANDELAALYDVLVRAGASSAEASVVVGLTIEDLDIADLEEMKGRSTDSSMLEMYGALQCGSRNHMRAFHEQLRLSGGSYEPQYIGAETYASIVASDRESCGQSPGSR